MIAPTVSDRSAVYVVDDDANIRTCLASLFQSVEFEVAVFGSAKDFLQTKRANVSSCLILDVRLPGMSGLELQSEMKSRNDLTPIIFMSGHADVRMSVDAMKAGAVEFLCKPFREQDLLDAVNAAIELDSARRDRRSSMEILRGKYEHLTPREREIMRYVASGMMNKAIAHDLSLSEITVKVHRASIFRKMEARCLAELVRQSDALGKNENVVPFTLPTKQASQRPRPMRTAMYPT